MAKSFIDNSTKKLKELILEYEDFLKDDLIEYKANNLCTNAWHIFDWILVEFRNIHGYYNIGDLRNSLYPRCNSLKIMHDIANASKHNNLDRPKASIRTTNMHEGDFCKADFSSDDFDVSRLEIELEDGMILNFNEEIKNVIEFWKSYFNNDLEIDLN
ncbi:hypothetical protein RT99_22740 [Flavobacterium sp. MEB061]|uniref:hypothetical protein n=1 Tax=Flavobacterium sp. MEB061 TaxID=1587524 RepID=UPI0005ABE289|nr:hypothetical protein [Flavobacterium sp. MEB061]KIQ14654.1 hypothetical protein RT99_22740 [Flavobacterium sp. MEB061]